MAKFKPQYRRLIFIDQKIREGMRIDRLPNCSSLAKQWEVSRKTIQRDIDYMKYQLSAPIEYDPMRHGYYYSEESFKLPAIQMRQSDLFAMCIAEEVMRQYQNTPIYDNLVTVFETLEKSLPDKIGVDPRWLHERFSFFPEAAPDMDHDVWLAAFEALRDGRTLEFDYQNPGWRKVYRRTVDPYHAVSYKAEWYVIGYCHYMETVRSYAVSRMRDIRLTDRYFVVPGDFDFKRFAGSHFGIMFGDEEQEVTLRFDAAAAPYVLERRWHPTQAVKRGEDGSVDLSFRVNHLFEVKRWVLSWGRGVTVLAPDELAEMVREEMEAALAGYAPGS